jgi:protein-tyrosine kinase
MARHHIALSSADWSPHLGQPPIEDDRFRQVAQDALRPRRPGIPLFRSRPATDAPISAPVCQPATPRPLPPLNLVPHRPEQAWESLHPVRLEADALGGKGLFLNIQQSPESAPFDILRTRLLHAMQDRGWTRIAITSPTQGCGKTLVAANLAISLARRPSSRTVLLDLELRQPGLAQLLGLADTPAIRGFLRGEQPLDRQLQRVGHTLALGLNGTPMPDAAEVLHDPSTAGALDAMIRQLDPEVVVIDAPAVLVSDDVLALLPLVDAVILVVDGTQTTAEEVRACERLFEGQCPLMGVVLNRAQDRGQGRYRRGRT